MELYFNFLMINTDSLKESSKIGAYAELADIYGRGFLFIFRFSIVEITLIFSLMHQEKVFKIKYIL